MPRIRITEGSPLTVEFEDVAGSRFLAQIGHVLGEKKVDWTKTAKTCEKKGNGLVIDFVAKP